jgi:hypothetical protein
VELKNRGKAEDQSFAPGDGGGEQDVAGDFPGQDGVVETEREDAVPGKSAEVCLDLRDKFDAAKIVGGPRHVGRGE